MKIRKVDVKQSTQDYPALTDFMNQIRAERLPDDPPIGLEERVALWQNIPEVVDLHTWVVDGPQGQIAAMGEVEIVRLEQNQHAAQMDLMVLPQYRRQGWGRRLLAELVEVAQREGRTLMIGGTSGRVPAGEAFATSLGAERALETHTNQLVLAELAPALLDEWIAKAQQRAAGFSLGYWDGPYPEDQLEAIAHLIHVMNSAPRGNLQVDDFEMTPELLRQIEKMMFSRGQQRWTAYVRDNASGKFAGFTEVTFSPKRPQFVHQQSTGVFPEYRNLGLGRWLKAAMLKRVLNERPEARFVRTGNADSNQAMLSINYALGFKPYSSEIAWQIETAKLHSQVANIL